MLDKIFSKRKKEEDIFSVPQRKNNVDLKSLSKLGPKALQQIVEQQQKYISILTSRIDQIAIEYRKTKEKSDELHQKNDLINVQVSKMSNQHEQLTIKFDNLQNSLQIMIATNQQQFDAQLNFLKAQFSLNNLNQALPRTIEQVFNLYQDRFMLCSKISQQNKSLKQKIADIELRFDSIKEMHEQAQKEKGLNSLIPSLMESLEELKRERKNSASLKNNPLTPQMTEQIQLMTKQQGSTLSETISMRYAETMTSEQRIQSPKITKTLIPLSNIPAQCISCKEFSQQVESLKEAKQQLLEDIGEWSEKYQNLQNTLNQFKGQGREEKEETEKQVRSLKQQIQALEKQLRKQKQQNETFNKELEQFGISILALREENQSLLKEIQAKQYEISLKEADMSNLRLKVSQTKEEQNGTESVSCDYNLKHSVYQVKLRQQSLQNESNLQQILSLRQEIIQKASQISQLNSLIQKSQSQLKRMGQSFTQSEQLTNKVQIRYKKMMAENEQEMMGKIRSLQTKISESEKQLIYLRNTKLNTQQDIKKVSKQRKVMQQAVRELQSYKKDVQQRILPTIRQQLQSLKKQYKRTTQQKQVMQEHSLQTMSQLNLSYEQVVKEKETLSKEKQQLEVQMGELRKEVKSRKSEVQTYEQTINKLNKEITDKLLLISKNADQLKAKSIEIDQLYQQLKSKQRKYESQLNQERIKTETMKRTISVQETKLQENELSSNKLYEDSIHKDKKINYMELKLKQYKHLIQSLKKEKDQIEKTYTDKITNYQTITEVTSQEEISTERTKQDNKEQSKSEGNFIEVSSSDKDTQYFQNQILSYQESNIVLKQENSNLRQKIKDLQDELHDRKKQVENLQEKRQQTLKEIQKLNLRSVNGSLQPVPSKESIQKEKQFLKEKSQLQAERQKSQQRTKKVALKAYKGFDILLKKHLTLYKEFMAVFVKELADREQVKNIQSEINLLVNKSTDMKDVFQDYL